MLSLVEPALDAFSFIKSLGLCFPAANGEASFQSKRKKKRSNVELPLISPPPPEKRQKVPFVYSEKRCFSVGLASDEAPRVLDFNILCSILL